MSGSKPGKRLGPFDESGTVLLRCRKNFSVHLLRSGGRGRRNMAEKTWSFRLSRREFRVRQIILEGYASRAEERPEIDEVFWLLIIGPDFLSLEVSRELLGERLLDFFTAKLGSPVGPPRIIVGGHEGEEGALSQVEWRFPSSGRDLVIRTLAEVLGHPLPHFAPGAP